MDGLLINTEDIYTEVTNELLAEHGKGELTWEVKIQLQGRPSPEVSVSFHNFERKMY
jgi:pseudouridine-5'-monophosphatase